MKMYFKRMKDEWTGLVEQADPLIRAKAAEIAVAHAHYLSIEFYRIVRIDPHAEEFLSNEQVERQLKSAMERWIINVLSAQVDDVERLIQIQHTVAEVHARIGIPVEIVEMGFRVLKKILYPVIFSSDYSAAEKLQVYHFSINSIDIAMEVMTRAFTFSDSSASKEDENYRIFSLLENAEEEKERQIASILSWEIDIIYKVLLDSDLGSSLPLSQADFGLWFNHKGRHYFSGIAEVGHISRLIQDFDGIFNQTMRNTRNLNNGDVHALNNVSLQINRGEIVGLVGESGSGKSVTAMLIMRLLPTGSYCVHRGQISLLGEDVLNAREKQLRQWRGARVAMIFQEPMTALNPTRRIGLQMMDVIRHHQPISRREARAKAIDLLEEMQIPDAVEVMSRYPFELSGGMRQRVMIALAFSCEPQLIIADEPTTALDVTVQLQVLRLLKHKARASGTAVLFISHDMAVVSQLCDSVYVMYAGSVIESGVTADVIHHPRHPYTIGLLQCAPEHGIPRQPLPAIPGTVPNLTHLPDGCAFRDRCYAAGAQCENVPALTACGDNNQRCACWYPQQEVISV
ncbi:ATP-binding cassette domain-containing protein [Escherichia coli]|nr:ATP-binding cassette domain-containing protein [Escherichia coli]EKP2680735.1 ATP-binding cassette domain-containing protein [Escherichia coli]EKP2700731.1 ATP-binding cassette domain-containing protein [Escherichia coli]EKP2710321.1 ATP-binding cassette domain-containing protein [Escherichia coli]EKP2769406.1 ATP-binding cassette domain-containing protein [Escherichia coli]